MPKTNRCTCAHLAVAAGLLACVATASISSVAAEPLGSEACTLERGPSLSVVRIVDAETIALDDGSMVRLIGALAPRSENADASDPAWPPEHAAREALERLLRGRTVELEFGERRSDRYGRLLAHVFVEREGTRVWVQEDLLEHGLARAYALPGNTACLKELLAAERPARESGRGLWANSAYRVREANATRELLKKRYSFEIVEGVVQSVAEAGGRIHLNFGEDWRRDFTAAVPSRLVRSSPEAKARLMALAGSRVRVRGWIERRNGPLVDIGTLSEIEVLEARASQNEKRPAAGQPGASDR